MSDRPEIYQAALELLKEDSGFVPFPDDGPSVPVYSTHVGPWASDWQVIRIVRFKDDNDRDWALVRYQLRTENPAWGLVSGQLYVEYHALRKILKPRGR